MATRNRCEADLPELTTEQLAKLYVWGQASCEHFDVRMNGDGTMALDARRKRPDTARGHMRLLRTNLINWGVSLPMKQSGWLRVISDHGTPAQANCEDVQKPSTSHKESTPRAPYHPVLRLPENLLTITAH